MELKMYKNVFGIGQNENTGTQSKAELCARPMTSF